MSLDGPIARLSGKRFAAYRTRSELKGEVEDLTRIRDRLREENHQLRRRLDAIAALSNPDADITFEYAGGKP